MYFKFTFNSKRLSVCITFLQTFINREIGFESKANAMAIAPLKLPILIHPTPTSARNSIFLLASVVFPH